MPRPHPQKEGWGLGTRLLESRAGEKRAERVKKADLFAIIMSRGGDVARVYIGDLGSGGSKPELEKEFERYGPLKSVWVARNPPGMKIICEKKVSKKV